jgi:TonB-linked SusC/RagA family outer membrane protein
MRIRILDSLSITAARCLVGVRALVPLAALIAAHLATAAPAQAQAGEVAGTVTATGSGEPLAGAQIIVVGGTQRAVSDERGRFRISGLTSPSVTLEVRRIGYSLQRVTARAGEANLTVALAASPTSLERVVVTGTVGATERRAIGNSVATISASEITATSPIVSMQSLINARAPGVVVMPTSGMVGTGSQIRIRGTSSFSLGNNPLIYVDGVRVNNAVATGPQNQDFGSSSISRLNDINPLDIESIEVLKGPSAATLYGTEASNGVINIITKRGVMGTPRWTATLRQGANYLRDWKTRFPTNYGVNPVTRETTTVVLDSLIAGNQGQDIFRTGRHQENELSVSGGTERLQYYASGHFLDSKGAEPNNATRNAGGRLNLALSPSSQIRLTGNLGVINGRTDLAGEGGFGGLVWTRLLATPANYNNPRRHGFHSLLPYQYNQTYKFWQDIDRYTTSVRADHTPVSWFQHHLTAGMDRTREGDNRYQPRIDSLVYTVGSGALGYRVVNQRTVTFQSLDYAATATFDWRQSMRFATSVGAQYYHNATDSVYAEGAVFPTPGLSSVNATTQGRVNSQDFLEDKTLGLYAQEQFSWRDRVFLTAAVRSDDNSAFGANFNRVVYPKFSVSWVLSEEPWFTIPGVGDRLGSLRLRAAYGEAGKAPATYAALRAYGPVSGPGDTPAITPQFIGNADLAPERGKEYELGFDANALGDRLGLEFTYYNKKTTDAILNREIAPSIGFSGFQPFNAGAIRNTGTELMVRGTPVLGDRVSLDLTFNYATNTNKVLELVDGATFFNSGSFTRHVIGYPAFGFWEKRVVAAQLGTDGRIIANSVMCDDGNGGSTLCAGADLRYGTTDDAPLVFLGRSVPPREGSVSGTLTLFGRWNVYSMFDFKRGHRKIDGNTRVRCTPVIGNRCRESFYPAEFDPIDIAAVQNSNLVDYLIDDASFTKWRELSVAYDIPEQVLRMSRIGNLSRATVSVSGRNLKTWTKFKGFEPEAMWLGGTRGGNVSWEQTLLPQLTSWIVTLNLGF